MGAGLGAGRHRKGRGKRASGCDQGNHNQPPVAFEATELPSDASAGHSVSPFVAASAAIVAAAVTAASSVAVQPQIGAQSLKELDISSAAMLLAAASSPLNIPVNLLIDIANIPHYEVQALNYEAAAFFFTGSWWVSNATNVWGTDPGEALD